jgi:hypothetical protein
MPASTAHERLGEGAAASRQLRRARSRHGAEQRGGQRAVQRRLPLQQPAALRRRQRRRLLLGPQRLL